MHDLQRKMLLATVQHIEGSPECEIAHDIEAKEGHPVRRVHGFAGE
jgi:hypothetical protein